MLHSLCLTEQIHFFHALILVEEAEKTCATLLQPIQNLSLGSLPATTPQQLGALFSLAFLLHLTIPKAETCL